MVKENSVILNEIDKARLKLSIEHYTKYFIGKRTCEISKEEALKVISLAVREFAMDRMYQTIARYNKVNSKRVYYLSIEYLIGRSLENNLHNLGLFNILKNIKIDGWPWESLEEIFDTEYDPAGSDGWPPVTWIRWPRSAFPVSVTASTMNTACSNKNLKTAIR